MKPVHLLLETHAFMPPPLMIGDLAEADALRHLPHAPHSVAEILAHLDFWQTWFLKRCRGEGEPMITQAALGWPIVVAGDWEGLRTSFLTGLGEASDLGDGDLSVRLDPPIEFPAMADYTIGDALHHLAVHNAHHLGQVVLMRQMLKLWPPISGSWTW